MLKIWGRISSINVRKVVLAAQWLRVPFERVDAGREFGVVKTPEYLAQESERAGAARWKTATSSCGSRTSSCAICARSIRSASSIPKTLRRRFDAERWMDWQQTTLNPAPAATPSSS